MQPVNSMTASIITWLFGGVSILHLVAAALVWVAAFIPGKLGFKQDSMLRICTGIFLSCEVLVTLIGLAGTPGLLCTFLGGAALFFGIGRLIRWLVIRLKKS